MMVELSETELRAIEIALAERTETLLSQDDGTDGWLTLALEQANAAQRKIIAVLHPLT